MDKDIIEIYKYLSECIKNLEKQIRYVHSCVEDDHIPREYRCGYELDKIESLLEKHI